MRHWFENRLTRLLAAVYVATWERAIAALPHDESSSRTTHLPDAGGPVSGPVRHRSMQSETTTHQLVELTIYATPPEQPERNDA